MLTGLNGCIFGILTTEN